MDDPRFLPKSSPKSSLAVRKAGTAEEKHCTETLKLTAWFAKCSDNTLKKVAAKMVKEEYAQGDVIINQGDEHEKIWIISSGTVYRWRKIGVHSPKNHVVAVDERTGAIGMFHILPSEPCYATAVCQDDVTCYSIAKKDLLPLFNDPVFSREVVSSLNLEIRLAIRTAVKLGRTPLLENKPRYTSYIAASVAAAIESFYRSGMNAFINAAVSGQKLGALFPNMHMQVPTRVLYINGLKGLRLQIEESETMRNIDSNPNANAVRVAAAIAPGVIMTPMSSLLEAYNAGHMNKEPIYRRWMRGVVPRTVREIIFAVGLNQLSDYCEERADFISNPILRGFAGSMFAGVVAGYLSHVPHNISTLKLLEPHKSYRQIFSEYIAAAETRLPRYITVPSVRRSVASVTAFLFPRGCLIRTVQIIGSFCILNGTMQGMQRTFPILGPRDVYLSRLHQEQMQRMKAERESGSIAGKDEY